MYKLLLVWRYLLTRYIAMISIVSITLGVATMIVVNAVMLGFKLEMETTIHGNLSDVSVGSRSSLRGFDDVDQRIRDVWAAVGDMVEAVTPTVTTPGLLSFDLPGGEVITSQVQVLGIDELTHEKVTSISGFLQHPTNREHLSFLLLEEGYQKRNPRFADDATVRPVLEKAGWQHRRQMAKYEKFRKEEIDKAKTVVKSFSAQSDLDLIISGSAAKESELVNPYDAALQNLPRLPDYNQSATGLPEEGLPDMPSVAAANPLDNFEQFQYTFDKETQQHTGVIVGMGLVAAGSRQRWIDPETNKECFRESLTALPGDDVTLSFLAVGIENSLPEIVYDRFTITDLYECRMAEYDYTFVFVPLARLQELRKMVAADGTRLATNLLIKAKPGVRIEELRNRLQEAPEFSAGLYTVETWRDKQATILMAVAMELAILNVLLFLIIAVAGFGILAIFFMIVVEKTRDIGILKSLGAGSLGIMQIFLMYGLMLGVLGSGIGVILGLWFVRNINEIASALSKVMGHEVFDPSVYMFQRVPAIVEPQTVCWIVIGSILIAVISGVLPALRAARLRPVDALRI